MMKALTAILVVAAAVLVAAAGSLYGGVFNAAADDPHWAVTHRLIESGRERSIAARSRNIVVPPTLDDPPVVAMGAAHYSEMCTGCHLAPGMEETEIRSGLYPQPPNLTKNGDARSPAETFWIIKHGLKMTGMPAWGVTHNDQMIWAMVAFVRRLPRLSQAEYEELVSHASAEGHVHEGDETAHCHEEASGDADAERGDRAREKSQQHSHDGHPDE